MKTRFFFIEDLQALQEQINNLKGKIKELGQEQAEAASQSTENMGHDDACQESIYQQRRIYTSQIEEYSKILSSVCVVSPSSSFHSVAMGATVMLEDGSKIRIGSYMILANHPILNVSYASPIAKKLLGKKIGDMIEFKSRQLRIVSISAESL